MEKQVLYGADFKIRDCPVCKRCCGSIAAVQRIGWLQKWRDCRFYTGVHKAHEDFEEGAGQKVAIALHIHSRLI